MPYDADMREGSKILSFINLRAFRVREDRQNNLRVCRLLLVFTSQAQALGLYSSPSYTSPTL
eukprot:scaffold180403_cov19-Tisochrysis_lutea.AAC.1